LLQEYLRWLKEHNLQDADSLPNAATEAIADVNSDPQNLNSSRASSLKSKPRSLSDGPLMQTRSERKNRSKRDALLGQLWMDGFSPHSAVQILVDDPHPADSPPISHSRSFIEYLWVDGFSDLSEPELGLLVALLPHCRQTTITFCLDHVPL